MSASTESPQRLYLMQVATLPTADAPVPCYLIQTGDGASIMVLIPSHINFVKGSLKCDKASGAKPRLHSSGIAARGSPYCLL